MPGHLRTLPLALGLLMALPGCMNYTEVQVLGVREARLDRLDTRGLSATVAMEVANPNSYKITVQDPDVDLFLNDMALGKATMDQAVALAPDSTAIYQVPLQVAFSKEDGSVLPVLLMAALNRQMKLTAKGTVVGKARGLRKRFPFEVEHVLAPEGKNP